MCSAYGAWCVGEDFWTAEKSLVFKKQKQNKKKRRAWGCEVSMCAECFLAGPVRCVCAEGRGVVELCRCGLMSGVIFFLFSRKQVPVLFPHCLPEKGQWKSERARERMSACMCRSASENWGVLSAPPLCVGCLIRKVVARGTLVHFNQAPIKGGGAAENPESEWSRLFWCLVQLLNVQCVMRLVSTSCD